MAVENPMMLRRAQRTRNGAIARKELPVNIGEKIRCTQWLGAEDPPPGGMVGNAAPSLLSPGPRRVSFGSGAHVRVDGLPQGAVVGCPLGRNGHVADLLRADPPATPAKRRVDADARVGREVRQSAA